MGLCRASRHVRQSGRDGRHGRTKTLTANERESPPRSSTKPALRAQESLTPFYPGRYLHTGRWRPPSPNNTTSHSLPTRTRGTPCQRPSNSVPTQISTRTEMCMFRRVEVPGAITQHITIFGRAFIPPPSRGRFLPMGSLGNARRWKVCRWQIPSPHPGRGASIAVVVQMRQKGTSSCARMRMAYLLPTSRRRPPQHTHFPRHKTPPSLSPPSAALAL